MVVVSVFVNPTQVRSAGGLLAYRVVTCRVTRRSRSRRVPTSSSLLQREEMYLPGHSTW